LEVENTHIIVQELTTAIYEERLDRSATKKMIKAKTNCEEDVKILMAEINAYVDFLMQRNQRKKYKNTVLFIGVTKVVLGLFLTFLSSFLFIWVGLILVGVTLIYLGLNFRIPASPEDASLKSFAFLSRPISRPIQSRRRF
jgi:hypothetical protein